MKTKLFIVGMLLLSLIVLSGCNYKSIEELELERGCLKKTAEKFCENKDCVVDSAHDYSFLIYKGEWREETWVSFTDKEIEFCENKQ